MNTTFRKVSELSFEEAVRVWNLGFEGYFMPMTITLEAYMRRTANEGLSLEHSLVMYVDDEPAGFVLNGFREVNGEKVAWNGGTGIAPAFRGQGIGKKLMMKNLELYREQGVDIATLEALSQNENAIKLYKSVGYEWVDQLVISQHEGTMNQTSFKQPLVDSYSVLKGLPRAVSELTFYKKQLPWQTGWQSIKDGESIILKQGNEVIGYALYKHGYDKEGNLIDITLYQCEVFYGFHDQETAYKILLGQLYAPLDYECKRKVYNLPESNEQLHDLLGQLGFTTTVTQVFMIRKM